MEIDTNSEDDQTINDETLDISRLQSEMNLLSRSDGSGIFFQGETIMLASVYGPIEAKVQQMQIEKAVVQAHFRPKSGLPGVQDRFYESFIRNSCEIAIMTTLYPRSVITITVQEFQNCGGLVSCAINAACLALMDAGIEMKFMVGGVSCMLDKDDKLIIEPNRFQLENAVATFNFAFNSTEGLIVASHTTGQFDEKQYMEAIRLCKLASAKVFTHFKSSIKKV